MAETKNARWGRRQLSEFVASLESGSRPRGGVDGYLEGVPSVSAEHISDDGDFKWDAIKYVPREFFAACSKGRITPNAILIVKDGATTGKAAFVDVSFPFKDAMVNEHTFVLRTKDSLLAKFVYYYLRSPYCADYFAACRQRGVIGGLISAFPSEIDVPVPSPFEQRRIVDVIDSMIQRLNKATLSHQSAMEDVENVIQAQIERKLRGLAGDVVSLGTYLVDRPRNGWSPPGNSLGASGVSGVPVLILSAVTGFRFDGSKVKYTSAPTSPEAHYWLKRDELLITRSNTPELVGHAAIYDGMPSPCICPDLIMKMRVDASKADVRFIHFWLRTNKARQHIMACARGTSSSMEKITQSHVQSIPVPRVEVELQRQLADELVAFIAETERLAHRQVYVEKELAAFVPALLTKAFRGEL